jgi:2-polyprenyl-3-methyl-5-hydroxy-6-metoxy-1,4-benzoquinol methylase
MERSKAENRQGDPPPESAPPEPGITGARCAWCGGSPARRMDAGEGFQLVECRRCGFVSTFPQLPGSEIEHYYPEFYYGRNNRRFNPLFEWLIRIFRARRAAAIERFVASGRALDVGCGRGLLPSILRERGWEAHGLEISPTAARHARDHLHIPVFVGNLLESPYSRDYFEVVVFWHVLEHLADPAAALRRSREILKPGGLLVVAVPNYDSLQARLTGRHWFHLDIPRHYHHFRLPVLRRLLQENGFTVDSVSHFSLEQNPYGWIQSLLNRMGFRRNLLYEVLKSESARSELHPLRAHPVQSLLMLPALAAVIPLSFALFLLEIALGRGGTVEIYARKAG